jgi:hypothetical protein
LEDNTKHNKTILTLAYDCPLKYIGETDRTFHTRYKNIHRQLEVIMTTLVDNGQVG